MPYLRRGKRSKAKTALTADRRSDSLPETLTLNPDLPDWTVSSLVAASHHQLIVSKLRHGEVHEVPAGDVNFAVDVARLPEHHLEIKCGDFSCLR